MFGTKFNLDSSASVSVVRVDSTEESESIRGQGAYCSSVQRIIRKLFLLFPASAEGKFLEYFQTNCSIKITRIFIAITAAWNIALPFYILFAERYHSSIHFGSVAFAGCTGIIHLLLLGFSFLRRDSVIGHREKLLLVSQLLSLFMGSFTTALHGTPNIIFYAPFPFLFSFTRFFIAVSYPLYS